MNKLLAAASVGHAIWFSRDEGLSWARPHTSHSGLYNEVRAWCLATHPDRPGELLCGTDQGLYRWSEADQVHRHVPSPMDALHILKIARAPADPRLIVAGTRPAAIFVSDDDRRRAPQPRRADARRAAGRERSALHQYPARDVDPV